MTALVPQTYRLVEVADLEPHPENPHRGDVELIAESIEKNGFYGTVMVQKGRMRIIAGEHRWRGAQAKGLEQVPALVVDVDDDTAKRIMLVDNRTAEYGGYDEQVLSDLLRGLPDLEGTGWTDDDPSHLLADLDSSIEVVTDSPAAPRPAVASAGEDRPGGSRPRPDPGDQDDEVDDEDDLDNNQLTDMPPPRPKPGVTADLLLTLTAAEHDEMNSLLSQIRARDGDASRLDPTGGTVHRSRTARVELLGQESLQARKGRARDVFLAHLAGLVRRGLSEDATTSLTSLGLLAAGDLNKPIRELSMGQQRRLDLAIALAGQPHVLLMDEPTNHLSITLVDELTEALQATDAAVVLATHDRQLRRDTASWAHLRLTGVASTTTLRPTTEGPLP